MAITIEATNRKTVIAKREHCGADLYLWSIRTDDGKWMSEFGCSVPSFFRKLGLASKQTSIAPAAATKFASRAEAEVEALERGLDWLQETRILCSGEALELIDDVLPMLEASIRELRAPDGRFGEPVCTGCQATLPEIVAAAMRGEAKPDKPAPVAAATSPRTNGSKRPSLVKAAGSESQPTTSLVGARVVELPVDKIHRRPSNRGGVAVSFPDVADLMESVEVLGLSQPIQVRDGSDEQALPLGHYELVKGERRWTAFRALGRDTIPAIVLVGLTARDASIQAGIDNTHGRALDPIQRLLEIRHAMEHDGCTLEEAALSRGLKAKQAEGDLRVLQLPADLQQAIADGKLAISVARAMLPYREIPAAVKRFATAVKKQDYRLQRTQDGDKTLRKYVLDLVREVTRPLDASTTYYAGYQTGQVRCEPDVAKHLTDELKRTVKAVEVRIDNKPTLLAQDVKAWEQANAAAKEERQQREAKSQLSKAKQAPAAGKAANPKAEAQQDDSLDRKVREWKHRFLRQAIAKHLVAGDYRTRKVARWVLSQAKDGRFGGVLNQTDWLLSIASQRGLVNERSMDSQWDLIHWLVPDAGDPVTEAEVLECELARLLLWPVASKAMREDSVAAATLAPQGQLPLQLPALADEEVEAIAEYLAGPTIGPSYSPWPTRLKDAWARGRQLRSDESAMIAELISYPNRRQLAGWISEWGVDVDAAKKLDDARHRLEQAHTSVGLKLLKRLEGGGKKGKRR